MDRAVLKFDKNGKFVKTWGKWGSGDGEFDQPHALAFDSKGLLYIGDRNNNRVQVFDQDGKFKESSVPVQPAEWHLHRQERHPLRCRFRVRCRSRATTMDWKRGIRIGSVKDGKVTAFIPDPDEKATGTSAAEGVVVDSMGNVYGAEVGPRAVKKYVKK